MTIPSMIRFDSSLRAYSAILLDSAIFSAPAVTDRLLPYATGPLSASGRCYRSRHLLIRAMCVESYVAERRNNATRPAYNLLFGKVSSKIQGMNALRKVTREIVQRRSKPEAYFRRQSYESYGAEFSRKCQQMRPVQEQRRSCHQAVLFPLSALWFAQRSASSFPAGCDGDDAGNDASNTAAPPRPKPKPEIDEDCPFCRFFLAGPCRNEFVDWHACVQTSEKATDCMNPFRPLKQCMDEHAIVFGGDEDNDDNSKPVSDGGRK